MALSPDVSREWRPLELLWMALNAAIAALRAAVSPLITFVRLRLAAAAFPVPGKPLPLVGHLYEGLQYDTPGLVKYMISLANETPLGVLWVGVYPVFAICDPRDIERIVTNPSCNEKSWVYQIVKDGMGSGLTTISGEQWKRHHKFVAPAFHARYLNAFVPSVNRHADLFTAAVRARSSGGAAFDVAPLSQKMFLAVVGETGMGLQIDSHDDPRTELVHHIETVEECLLERLIRPWLYPDWTFALSSAGRRQRRALAAAHAVRNDAIAERSAALEAMGDVRLDGRKRDIAFLDYLLLAAKSGEPISRKDIEDEVDNFAVAAFETLSLTFSYVMYELACNPGIQDKLIEELKTIFDPTVDRIQLTTENINRLIYAEMIIKETLRFHPPIPLIMRTAKEDIQMASRNLTIPAGAQLFLTNVVAHFHPDYYKNPTIFDPEHFRPETCKQRHPYAFFPFSGGARGCVGKKLALMELKAALAKVIWEVEVLEEPTYSPVDAWGISMKPMNGVFIRARERKR